MNTTYARLELLRTLRDYVSLLFVVALPAFFYLIFGWRRTSATRASATAT